MEGDYSTLDDVKGALGITDTQDDAALARIITAVSRHIDAYCWRRFYAKQEERTYTASFDYWLDVDDLLSIASISTDADGDREFEMVWSVQDYDLLPDNAALDGKPFTSIVTSMAGAHDFPVGVRKGVKVAGLFGYAAATPAPVREACILQSARIFKRKDAPFGVTGSAEMGQLMVIAKLDPDVKQMLDPFKRWQ